MSHFEPFPNQNQVICSDEQFLMSRGLPVRKWPSDLFKCNAAHAEIMTEDDPVWAPPFNFDARSSVSGSLRPNRVPSELASAWVRGCHHAESIQFLLVLAGDGTA
jgi:hypothetical protein